MLGGSCGQGRRGPPAAAALSSRRSAASGDELVAAADESARPGLSRGSDGPEGDAWVGLVSAAEHARLRWLTGIDAPSEDEPGRAWETSGRESSSGSATCSRRARSQARLASVLRAVGRADDARELGRPGDGAARRLGAEPLLAELRMLGRGPERARGRLESRRDEPLTTGRTRCWSWWPRAAATRDRRLLYISAKTVSVHVSNILAKLGAAGRTEAVAIARRHGVLAGDSR